MSRSKHTRPRHVLAASRIRAPYEPRGSQDRSLQRRVARAFKEQGVPLDFPVPHLPETAPLPRIVVQPPRAGHCHPASKAAIEELLHFFGPACFYGLRRIDLVQGHHRDDRLVFGRLLVPGRIILYDQKPSPWTLAGALTLDQRELLRRAGAVPEIIGAGLHTTVAWPGETLRDFLRFDVLMHEIGHHMIQQYKGKRTLRVARSKDHERWADAFAHRCRCAYQKAGAD
jgi:hypothetical protein